jgi:hypothetical protein
VESVRQQELPPGWELEWLVQEDGEEPRLADDPAVNWLYRHHATQLSHQENWWRTEVSDKALVIQRVHALPNGPQSKPLAVADIGTIPFRAGERLASGWWLQDDDA